MARVVLVLLLSGKDNLRRAGFRRTDVSVLFPDNQGTKEKHQGAAGEKPGDFGNADKPMPRVRGAGSGATWTDDDPDATRTGLDPPSFTRRVRRTELPPDRPVDVDEVK